MREVLADMQTDRASLARQFAMDESPAKRRQVKPSRRAQRLWDRLGDWYGARFADQFGDQPSQDWCTLVDNATNEELVAVLVLVRQRHVTYPPTLPEFSALVKEVRVPRPPTPPVTEQLTEFVLRTKTLSAEQLQTPWTFLFQQTEVGNVVSGVVIPANGDAPGHRVMVEDMQLADFGS